MKRSTRGLSLVATVAFVLGSMTTPASALVATPTTGGHGLPACTLELTHAEVDFYQSSLRLAQDTLIAEFKNLLPAAVSDIDLLDSFFEKVRDKGGHLADADLDRFDEISARILAAGKAAGLENHHAQMGQPVNETEYLPAMLMFFASFESFEGFFTHAEPTPQGVTAVLPAPHFQGGIGVISDFVSTFGHTTASPAEAAVGASFETLLPLETAMAPALQSCVDGVGGTFTPDIPGATPHPTAPEGGSSFGSIALSNKSFTN